MKIVVITGGTGLLGMRLSFFLAKRGYSVRHLSRRENLSALYPAYSWDLEANKINPKALENASAIIHLAGANLADSRWTKARKKVLISSRVSSTELLAEAIQKSSQKPSTFIACSAVGFYGSQQQEILTEERATGTDFMSEICTKWEQSSQLIRQQGIRTPIIRVGVVLSTQGGALEKLKMSYPFRIGSYFGNGQQYYPWIHIDDICQIFWEALQNESMTGIYNASAPNPATNKEIAQAIAQAYGKKALLLPIPAFLTKALMGEMSSCVLNSTRAIPQALQNQGFQFQYPNLVAAIKDLLDRNI